MEKKENLVLKKTENLTKFFLPSGRSFDMIIHGRGISAAGSAPRWQRGGHGFEPRMLHWKKYRICGTFFDRVAFCVTSLQFV